MNETHLRSIISGILLGFTSSDPETRSKCYVWLEEIATVENYRAEVVSALHDKLNANRRAPDAYRYIRSLSGVCRTSEQISVLGNVVNEMIPDALQKNDTVNLVALLNAVEHMGKNASGSLLLLSTIPSQNQNTDVRAACARAMWAILKP